MSAPGALGLNPPRLVLPQATVHEHVVVHRPLRTVLRFLGCSIDQVCDDPIVKNQVRGYYRLYRQVHRSMEIPELERWWNGAI